MNDKRRKMIREISSDIKFCALKLDKVLWQEQDAFGNMPDSMQASDVGDTSMEASDAMENAIALLDEAMEYMEEATA